MARMKTEDDLRNELIVEVERYESDAAAARAFDISRGHLSRVLRGLKPITSKIALGLGYEEQRGFVRDEERELGP
jgi:hypothetical protein